MRKSATIIAISMLTATFATAAFSASPDVYVVNFRNEKSPESQALDARLNPALANAGVKLEHVVIDTTTAARWEKGAHEAFDRNIVPVFNQWVGLPGFAAVVDAKTKKVLGCLNANFSPNEIANEIKRMSSTASGAAYISRAAFTSKSTECPPAYNTPPQ